MIDDERQLEYKSEEPSIQRQATASKVVTQTKTYKEERQVSL